jgi:hypothetical protein
VEIGVMAPGKLAAERRLSSAGFCTDWEVRIVDDEDRAAVGTIDEIVVRGDRGRATTRVAPTMNEPAKALRRHSRGDGLSSPWGWGGHPQRLKTPCITPIVLSACA